MVSQTTNSTVVEKIWDIDDTYLVVEVQVDDNKFKKGDNVQVIITK